jgi:hypothetical protein
VSSPEQLSELHESKAFSPQVVQLGSLSRDETQRFVNLKLQNGHSSKQALTAPERYLDLLFERSGGNIKRILTDAADTLPRFLGERAPPATSNTSHANSISILPVLGIALILVITSYFIITKSPLTAVTAPEQLAPSYVQSSGIYFPSAAMISDVLFLLTQG